MPSFDGHDLETDPHIRRLRVPREPHLRSATDTPTLLSVDRTDRSPERIAPALLHLDERQFTSAPDDQVELVATGANILP